MSSSASTNVSAIDLANELAPLMKLLGQEIPGTIRTAVEDVMIRELLPVITNEVNPDDVAEETLEKKAIRLRKIGETVHIEEVGFRAYAGAEVDRGQMESTHRSGAGEGGREGDESRTGRSGEC